MRARYLLIALGIICAATQKVCARRYSICNNVGEIPGAFDFEYDRFRRWKNPQAHKGPWVGGFQAWGAYDVIPQQYGSSYSSYAPYYFYPYYRRWKDYNPY